MLSACKHRPEAVVAIAGACLCEYPSLQHLILEVRAQDGNGLEVRRCVGMPSEGWVFGFGFDRSLHFVGIGDQTRGLTMNTFQPALKDKPTSSPSATATNPDWLLHPRIEQNSCN